MLRCFLRGRGCGCRCDPAGALQLWLLRRGGAGGVPRVSKSVQASNTSSLSKTVELNEVGFKFVRKCINAVETKGEELTHVSYGLEFHCSSCSTVLATDTGIQLLEYMFFY